MTEEFKSKIKAFLKEKNPYMHDYEIDSRIEGFWAQYKNHKTPEFDYWLQKNNGIDKLTLLKERLTEGLNWYQIANIIIQEFPIYYDKSNLWWLWNHERKCYEITDETDIANIVDSAARKNTLQGGVKSQMIEAFKRAGRKRKPLDIPKTWIQFKDKIIDTDNLEEIEPNPGYFLTNPIPHNLGTSELTPIIDALLLDWAGENALTLKQLLAYCTLRDYPIHRIFLLIGSGSNGKGTYLRMMNHFLGNENIASVEMDLIVSNQFHVTKLHNRLVAQMSETNFGTLKNTSMLKKLSGGDLVGFEYKNKLPFDGYNYAKIVIATNSLPSTQDKTDGFYRRWVIIEFNKQFSELKDVLKEIPLKEYENLCYWSAREIQRITLERKFHREGSIQDRKEKYEAKSNPLVTFLKANYELDGEEKVPAGFFFDEFAQYLISNGLRSVTYNALRAMMKDEGYEYNRDRFPLSGQNAVASIRGLKRKDQKQEFCVSSVNTNQLPPHMRDQVETTDTADTADTLTIIELRKLYVNNYAGQPIPAYIIQKKVPTATDSWLARACQLGDLIELPAGWYSLV